MILRELSSFTCLWTLQGKLEPRLIGATTATRVGEGADWRFLGGRAGGGLLMDKHKQRNEAPQMTDVFVPEAKSIPIIRQARKKTQLLQTHRHTQANAWIHEHTLSSSLWNTEMKLRVFHVNLPQVRQRTVQLINPKFAQWVNTTPNEDEKRDIWHHDMEASKKDTA